MVRDKDGWSLEHGWNLIDKEKLEIRKELKEREEKNQYSHLWDGWVDAETERAQSEFRFRK